MQHRDSSCKSILLETDLFLLRIAKNFTNNYKLASDTLKCEILKKDLNSIFLSIVLQ